MAQHRTRRIMPICLLLIVFLALTLRVLGGRDSTCPSDEFPLRLSAGSQGRTLESMTLYDYDLSTPITEIPLGARVSLPPGGINLECYLEMRFVYVETGDGFAGWVAEVAFDAYQIEPLGAAAPLSIPSFTAQPESFSAGQVDYNGVHFTVDSSLVTQVDAEYVAASDMRGYDPAHLKFTLSAASDQEIFMFIRVMSAQELDNYYPGTIAALRSVLDGVPGAEIPSDLQWVFSEAYLFAQPHKGLMPLGNGKAHWALMYSWQDEMYPSNYVTNSVHGLSDDGQYYIQGSFTTYYKDRTIYDAPTSDPEDPNLSALLETFHKNINDTIAAASDGDFTPRPSQLQALLSTLTIDAGTLEERITEANIVATGLAAPVPEVLPTLTPTLTDESAGSAEATSTPISALEDGCRVALMMEHLSLYITSPGAIQMSGGGSAILADVPEDLNFGQSDLSLSVWVYPSPASNVGGTIFDVQYFSDVTQGMRLSLDPQNKLIFEWMDVAASQSSETSWITFETNVEVPSGIWHLIGVTLDRDNALGGQIYLDGAPVFAFDATTNQDALGAYAQMTLGSNYYDGENDFYGVLKDLQFYHCLLTPEQMAGLYTGPLPMTSTNALVPATSASAASPSVNTLLTSTLSSSAMRIDARPLIDPDHPESADIRDAVFAPDGQTLATYRDGDASFRLWDAKTGQIIRTLSGHTEVITMLAFSPDSRLIVSAGGDSRVNIWDVQTGALVHTLRGHADSILSVIFSWDGQLLLTSSSDGTAVLWDVQTGERRHTFKESAAVLEARISPDGLKLLTVTIEHTLSVWDIVTETRILSLDESTFPVSAAAFLHDNETIFVAADNGTMGQWNLQTQQIEGQLGGTSLYSPILQLSHDGRFGYVVFLSPSQASYRINLETGETLDLLPGEWIESSVSVDQRTFYKVSQDNSAVEVWDLGTNTLIQTFQADHVSGEFTGIYGYDRQTFVTTDSSFIPYLWSAAGFAPEATSISAPTSTPILTPTPFPLYCPASPPSRILVGGVARVTFSAAGEVREDLRVRATAGGERIGAMSEGTRFRVTGSYQCVEDRIWWPIQTLDGALTGWVTEGAAPDDYYIEPMDE